MDYLNRIDDYITDRLTEEELLLFEAELKANSELQRELVLQKELHTAIAEKEIAELRRKLNIAYRNRKTDTLNLNTYKWYSIVAASLIGVVLYLAGIINQPTPNDLFEQYYVKYSIPSYSRGSNISVSLDKLIDLYNTNEYRKILDLYQNSLIDTSSNSILKLIIAVSYIETKNPSSAIKTLSGISANDLNFETSLWYMCLSQLQQGDKKNAYNTVIKIAEYNGMYSGKATRLKESIAKQIRE